MIACPACHTAAATIDAEAATGSSRKTLIRLGLAIFFAMNVMVFSMALWSQDVYSVTEEASEFAITLRGLFRYLTMLFALPVLFLLGGPILSGVWCALRRGSITTDLLIMLGVFAAFVYSAVTVIRGEGHVYFEVGSMVLIFVTLGRWLEASGRQKTNQSLDELSKLLPETVAVVGPDGIARVPREMVQVGDTLQVLPGERFGVDGRIVSGTAEIDEQVLTGESDTVTKGIRDALYSGTLNIDGDLRVEVTATAGNETISRLLDLVRTAREAKGRHARLADRVAAWFVPIVCLIAIVAMWRHGQANGLDAGILTGLAVILIACPCALGLATSMAISTALGRAASGLVLFRSGEALERLSAVRAVRFDKTGTLTSGGTSVAAFVTDQHTNRDLVLKASVALASASQHGFSAAICRSAGDLRGLPSLSDVKTRPGRGISAHLGENHTPTFLGSLRLMREAGFTLSNQLLREVEQAGAAEAPIACVGWGKSVHGLFVFRETLRSDARAALDDCRRLDLDVAVLTGDHQQRGARIAEELAVPVEAELLPENKVAVVDATRAQFGPVAMVGDGLNDAPALAAADVGVAMGCGADLSRESASVCLLSDDLQRFTWSVDLARNTVKIIRQNLFWAFAYNAVGIGLAVTGRLNPLWAAAAMALSSLFVVTNSLRLARFPDHSQQDSTRSIGPSPSVTANKINIRSLQLKSKVTNA
ncbi:MAG: heavy metal translocating P-type ATPase [Aeoliella sp.]